VDLRREGENGRGWRVYSIREEESFGSIRNGAIAGAYEVARSFVKPSYNQVFAVRIQ
jgi:hypothetical protein